MTETELQNKRSNTINLKDSMKNQILSMLKNVILDDVPEDDSSEEIHNTLFTNDEEDDENEETVSNTVTSNVSFNRSCFDRQSNEKFQTTQYPSNFKLYDSNLYLNQTDIIRNQRRFQTQNCQNANWNMMSTINSMSQNGSPFMNQNNMIYQSYNASPMMPLRTFTFKNSYLRGNESSNESIPIIPIVKEKVSSKKNQMSYFDILSVQLESMLIASKRFTMEIYRRMKGNFEQLIKNQQSSRLCQYFLDETSKDIIHLIFYEISSNIYTLLLDPYANYFCLKIFYFLNKEDRYLFLSKLSVNFGILSMNKISTYPIQCIVEQLEAPEEKILVIDSLREHVVKLSLNIYGTHVIERILTNFEYEYIKPISDAILENFLFLANNPNGLCVIKKEIIIENKQANYGALKKEISKDSLVLIQNPYGNYALQTVLENWDLDDCEEIMSNFYGKCILLSLQKYSSNVIEKCLERSQLFLQNCLREILMNDTSSTFPVLLRNNFGNYVIQTILRCLPNSQIRTALISEIKRNLECISDKKVTYKWKKIISSL